MTEITARLSAGAAEALGRPLREGEAALLYKYLNLLIKWQKTQRLVGSSDPAWIVDNVIVDSLLFTRALPPSVATLCDVGSGAGVPGVPLKIVLPSVQTTLLEARERRASFLSTVVRELALVGCRVLNRRLEDVIDELAGRFDAVVMRCAGDPVAVTGTVRRLLSPGGLIAASGPPTATAVPFGDWLEVQGPRGLRRFWIYRSPAA